VSGRIVSSTQAEKGGLGKAGMKLPVVSGNKLNIDI
jgi:hypothetical protein